MRNFDEAHLESMLRANIPIYLFPKIRVLGSFAKIEHFGLALLRDTCNIEVAQEAARLYLSKEQVWHLQTENYFHVFVLETHDF